MPWSVRLAALTLTLLPLATPAVAASQTVLASIKPIHSLVAAVMEGIGEPHLILGSGASPHTASLKPSDARTLEQAGHVFWVGEGLETFLQEPIETLASEAKVVELIAAKGLNLHGRREGGVWDAHVHDGEGSAGQVHEADAGDGRGHTWDNADAHIWLDPMNAKSITEEIATALADADPAHASAYRANSEKVKARLDALTAEINNILAPVKDRPFIVFHDAYRYLEERFDLNAVGSLTVTPDVQPGAGRLHDLREKIRALGAVCVFSEPTFEPRLVGALIEGTSARTGVLDPEGGPDFAPGPNLYFELMRRNAAALKNCLSPS